MKSKEKSKEIPRLPNTSQRIVELGRTGTGKTVAAVWQLSNFPLDRKPWIVIDFKTDEHINGIPGARHVDLGFIPGKKDTGIFIVHPLPSDADAPKLGEKSPIEQYIWKIWEREDCGIFCDEGYMMARNKAFEACLTQGRSKRIPMIVCSQRPSWLSRFVFSEADFFQVFHLNDARDQQTVQAFVPVTYEDQENLAEYHSLYYDVAKNKVWNFNPVPPIEEIYKTFESKLKPQRRWI